MEALIDLEQQADFFIVLGEDQAAVDLLLRHLDTGEGASPLLYLKLLQIHRRREDELQYARVSRAFEQRFGAAAPSWQSAAAPGRSLDDYPQALAQLQALWSEPVAAMAALDGWLFRREPNAEAFDFGACGDLLLLYFIACELQDAADEAIDILLPFAAGPAHAPPSRLAPDRQGNETAGEADAGALDLRLPPRSKSNQS